MASLIVGAVSGAVGWPWWAVPLVIVPLYALQAANTCGWRGCDPVADAIGGVLQVAIGLVVWAAAAWLRRRWQAAGSRSPRP